MICLNGTAVSSTAFVIIVIMLYECTYFRNPDFEDASGQMSIAIQLPGIMPFFVIFAHWRLYGSMSGCQCPCSAKDLIDVAKSPRVQEPKNLSRSCAVSTPAVHAYDGCR